MSKNTENCYVDNKYQFILSLFVCAIPASMVMGAAVMEFFIFLSCVYFFFLNFKKIGLNYYTKGFFLIFIIFCLFLIFSSLSAENILNSLRNTMFYFRFGILTLVIWYLLDNYKNFKFLFFSSITITLVVVIVYTIFELTIFQNYLQDDRISGLFGEESIQGSFLLRITPIFIIFYLYNKESINNNFIFLYYVILLSAFVLIILSGERTAIFLMVIGIILSFFFLKINYKKIFLYSLLSLLFFGLTIQLNPKIKKRVINKTFDQLFLTEKEPGNVLTEKGFNYISEGHQDHLETAVIMFKKHYLKGVGVRNFRIECKKNIYKVVGTYYCSTHPHNTYMQILSETGLIGFLFFMIFLVFVIIKIHDFLRIVYIKHQKVNIPLAVCFIVIIVNFLPFAPTGSFFNNWLSTLYFFPIGLLLYELNYKKNIN